VLGQLFLLACVAAALSVVGIFFVLFGPVPVKRRVTIVPRLAVPLVAPAMPSLAAQLAPSREQHFTPTFAVESAPVVDYEPPTLQTPHAPVAVKPKGQKVQPLPKKRAAKGTGSPAPFAPVVRARQYQERRDEREDRRPYYREEEVQTNPVRRVSFDSGEMTTVDDGY